MPLIFHPGSITIGCRKEILQNTENDVVKVKYNIKSYRIMPNNNFLNFSLFKPINKKLSTDQYCGHECILYQSINKP